MPLQAVEGLVVFGAAAVVVAAAATTVAGARGEKERHV